MLEKLIIAILLCIIFILVIFLRVQNRKLRDARKEVVSWKLACAAHENDRKSW